MTGPPVPAPPAGRPSGSPSPGGPAWRDEEHGEMVGALHAIVDLVERVQTRRLRGIGLLVALNAADVATTVWFLVLGGSEGNPVLAPIVHRWWLLVAVKAVVLAVLSRRILDAPARSLEAKLLVGGAVAYYLAVVVWNLSVVHRLVS
ncbi:MAG: DUF5658 family protein [Acidimicrobiales bacterium]